MMTGEAAGIAIAIALRREFGVVSRRGRRKMLWKRGLGRLLPPLEWPEQGLRRPGPMVVGLDVGHPPLEWPEQGLRLE